jgi:transposase
MRKQYSSAFKTGTVLDILRGGKPLTQIAAEKEVHPALAAKWRDSALAAICNSFERKDKIEEEEAENERKVAELYEQIGRLTLQVNWMKKKSGLDPDTL